MHLYLIRHGETDYNKNRIVQGSGIDSILNNQGKNQSAAFFYKYQHIDFDFVMTSQLKRTIETVEPFIKKGIQWKTFSELNEINWGIHEGKKPNIQLISRYNELVKSWGEGDLDARLEGGESAAELVHRTRQFLEIVKTFQFNNVLVCTHGRTLRCLMCLIKNQELAKMEEYTHSNTGLFKIQLVDREFQVLQENNTAHLF